MRFDVQEMDISIFVSLSDVITDTKAVVYIRSIDLHNFLNGNDVYTSIFKPLQSFDCGGRTIGEDWVRYISYSLYGTYTQSFSNQEMVISGLSAEYTSELLVRRSKIPDLRVYLTEELKKRHRFCFEVGDMLMYTTTISYASMSRRYLMQAIVI